jgi:hypothetical protein
MVSHVYSMGITWVSIKDSDDSAMSVVTGSVVIRDEDEFLEFINVITLTITRFLSDLITSHAG